MSVVHGGLDESELHALGIDPAGVLDLSANLHPAGPSPAVLRAARGARLDRYAPPDAHPLRAAIAAHEGLPEDAVLPTPGATAAIHLLARVLLSAGDEAAIFAPTFGEYEAAVRAAGAQPLLLDADPPAFRHPPPPRAAAAFLANPNNPTGTHLARAEVEALQRALGGTLVLDAAYEAFVQGGWDAVDLVRSGYDVAVVRSMTKLHAIPGVRLGYVVAAPELIARAAAIQHSWSIDAVAQAAGPVALSEHAARVAMLGEAWRTRARLSAALEGAGFVLGPSQANFLLVQVGDARATRHALLQEGILVRDCTSFGLPGWIRVAVPPAADEVQVTSALLSLRTGTPS